MRTPCAAVAIALLSAALATAGCGLGPGEDVGSVDLTVTRDYGAVPVLHRQLDDLTESDTVMRALEGSAEISTRYGGGFVQSIEGLEAQESVSGSLDWLYYVNGVEATVGAADYRLRGGESVWWDYHDWSAVAGGVPAVVGSWPQPFLDGYDGRRHPVAVECLGGGAACGTARERLESAGVAVASGSPDEAIRVLVGPWARLRDDPAAAQIEDGPRTSGVFADFRSQGGDYVLRGYGEDGEAELSFGATAGLVAATRRFDAPPVWVVSGSSAAGVQAAAGLLGTADLSDRYAVAVEAGERTPLPVR